jgi:LemA protein
VASAADARFQQPVDLNLAALAASFAIALVLVIAAFFVVTTYNDVVGLRLRIDKAWANIDVVLHQRHDQLPALVDAVRGMLEFERDVLDEVTRSRASYRPEAPIPDQASASDATSAAIRSLFAVVEAYPDLKSQGNVLALQESVERLEAMLAARRELYNDQVYRHNTRIQQLPAVLLAGLLGWRDRPFFEAPEESRTVPTADIRA